MLCTNIPKYESLSEGQKEILHEDKEKFNDTARKGGQILIYARAGTSDETWVPLIEKAYAKLYGCYAHLEGGWTNQSIEELTGSVRTTAAYCMPRIDLCPIHRGVATNIATRVGCIAHVMVVGKVAHSFI